MDSKLIGPAPVKAERTVAPQEELTLAQHLKDLKKASLHRKANTDVKLAAKLAVVESAPVYNLRGEISQVVVIPPELGQA